MLSQILPNVIFIIAVLGIILMVLRRLPEAVELQRRQGPELPAGQKLQDKGLPVQTVPRIKPLLQLWRKKIWNFMLEAKDLKPAAVPSYKLKKIFGRHFRAQMQVAQPQPQPAPVQPRNTAEVKDEKYFLERIKNDPKNLGNYDTLGRFYLEGGNYSDAKDIYSYLSQHEADNADFHARLAVSLYQLEQYDKAVEHYRKSLSLDSSQPTRYYNLGLSLDASGKPEEAITAFEQAVAQEPGNAKFYTSLGNVYKKLGQAEKAEAVLKNMPKESNSDRKIKVN